MNTPPFQLFDLIVLLSLMQGLALGAAILLLPWFRAAHNRFLAYAIILISVIGLNEWLSGWNFDDQYYLIDLLGDDFPWILLFFVPLLVYFLKETKHPLASSPQLWLLTLPFLTFWALNMYINLDVDFDWYAIPSVRDFQDRVYTAEFYVALAYNLLLCALSILAIRRAPVEGGQRRWLYGIGSFVITLMLLWFSLEMISDDWRGSFRIFSYILWGGIALFIYWLTYQGLYRLRLAQDQTAIQQLLAVSTGSSTPSPPTLHREKAHLSKLDELMTTQHLYRSPDLSREKAAELLHISPSYLSQIISSTTDANFSTYVNQYRVKEVKRMLLDPQFAPYSLLAIGLEAGFQSKAAFYATFKRTTGLTPSAFRKKYQN